MTKEELQTLARPVMDDDFCNIVVSAVRYALPRHSYMPSLTRDYIWKHWKLLSKMHWCILRDIREHYRDTLRCWENHPDLVQGMDKTDLTAWIIFYNQLIERKDTHYPEGERHQHTPLNTPQ